MDRQGPVKRAGAKQFRTRWGIQQLRSYGRRIHELNRDIVRCNQRIDMILQSCNIRFSNYVSNTNNKSYIKVVEALIRGETDPGALVKLIHGRTLNAHGKQTIRDSLEGNVKKADTDLLGQYTQILSIYRQQKQQCLDEMVILCKKHYNRAFQVLQTIPGIKEQSAAVIISEIGVDMKFFAIASALVSWAGLSPRNDESAGKIKSRKITHGNKYLRKALMESAWGASRTRGSAFHRKFWHLRGRNKKEHKCLVAVARSLLVVIWTLLTKQEDFDFNYLDRYIAKPA